MPVTQLEAGAYRVDGDLILEAESAKAEGGNELHEDLLIACEALAEHRLGTGTERFGLVVREKVAALCLTASGG